MYTFNIYLPHPATNAVLKTKKKTSMSKVLLHVFIKVIIGDGVVLEFVQKEKL